MYNEGDTFDVESIRNDFPILHQQVNGKDLVWFDNAATTQKLKQVIDAISNYYLHDHSNIHRAAHTLAARSTDAYEGAREKVQRFINASSTSEIIFVRGTTEGINLVSQTYGRRFLQPGDEVIVSTLLCLLQYDGRNRQARGCRQKDTERPVIARKLDLSEGKPSG